MSYLGELRQNMRPLLAASIGSGTSLPLFAYTNSVFAPHLIKEFGWSRSQFALIGLTMLTTLFVLPFIGRFTDKLGVRRVALIGTILVPVCFVGYAIQQGSFAFFVFVATSILAVGSMTSTLVYTRLIAESFVKAQGLALTIVNCTPAVLAIVLLPLINWTIETIGWRSSYLILGAFTLVAGVIAIYLIPARPPAAAAATGQTASHQLGSMRADFGVIVRNKVFWVIMIAMFLCLLQTPLHASQMNLMLIDNDLSPQTAANIVSVYAFGTIVGRLACGLALDRYSTPIVTFASMIIPALGYFVLGTEINTLWVVTAAMFLVGLSVGAESDLIAFLVARYFKLRIYSSTLSLIFCCSFLASASGAAGISLTLKLTDSYSPYLFVVAGSILVGSFLFLLMPKAKGFEKIG